MGICASSGNVASGGQAEVVKPEEEEDVPVGGRFLKRRDSLGYNKNVIKKRKEMEESGNMGNKVAPDDGVIVTAEQGSNAVTHSPAEKPRNLETK